MQTYYQRTISFEWEIQVFRQLFHHLISAHVESRHQGTFRRVIARMDDGEMCIRDRIDVLRKGVCNYYYLTNKSAIDKLGRLKEELEKYPES